MASHQVPDGAPGGQDLQLVPAPNKINAFHRFPNLPTELQDMVWKAAFELSPSVVSFEVTLTWSPEDKTRIVCFNPDAHTAASTRDQRTFLGICRETHQKALRFLTILSLYRIDSDNGKITEYMIPFDLEKSCFCVDGWLGLGMSPEEEDRARGLSFARYIKRLAFVIHDKKFKNTMISMRDVFTDFHLHRFPLLFHNAQHVSAITSSALSIRKLLGHEIFHALFSFQPFAQKGIVEGFHMTKPFSERRRILRLAMQSIFEDWNGRIRAALDQAGLLPILEEENLDGMLQLLERRYPDRFGQTEIDGLRDALPYLKTQAKRND